MHKKTAGARNPVVLIDDHTFSLPDFRTVARRAKRSSGERPHSVWGRSNHVKDS